MSARPQPPPRPPKSTPQVNNTEDNASNRSSLQNVPPAVSSVKTSVFSKRGGVIEAPPVAQPASEVNQSPEVKRLGLRNMAPMSKANTMRSPAPIIENPPPLATLTTKSLTMPRLNPTPSAPTTTSTTVSSLSPPVTSNRPLGLASATRPSAPRPEAKRPSANPRPIPNAQSSALMNNTPPLISPRNAHSIIANTPPLISPRGGIIANDDTPSASPLCDSQSETTAPQEEKHEETPPSQEAPAVTVVPTKREKRTFIIEEILSTETTYVSQLQELRGHFMDPLKKTLNEEEIKKIFSNLEVLETLHSELLRDLKDRWTKTQTIGDSLIRIIPFMKLYIEYINNYEYSSKTIDHLLSKSKSLRETVGKLGTEHWPGEQGLNSLRVTPIQRIPRYVMLLKDLKENTPADHIDYNKISEAHNSVSKMAEFINEKKRQDYNLKRVGEVAAKLKGNLNQGLNLTTDGTKSYAHHFKKKRIVKTMTCDFCKKIVMGKVYSCKSCAYAAHGKCYEKVPHSCTKPYEQALLIKPSRYIVKEGHAKHRKFFVQAGNKNVATNVKLKDCLYFIFNDAFLVVYPFEEDGEEFYEFDSLIKWRARGTGRFIEAKEGPEPKNLSIMSPRDLATHIFDFEFVEERATVISTIRDVVEKWKVAKKLTDAGAIPEGQPPEGMKLGLEDVALLLKLWGTASFQISNAVPVRTRDEKGFTAYVIEIKFNSGSVSVLKRYSEIHNLSRQLGKHFPAKLLPKMPEKKFFGNTSTGFVQKRCAKLQKYFNELTKIEGIWDVPEILSFLSKSLAEQDNKGEESDEEEEMNEDAPPPRPVSEKPQASPTIPKNISTKQTPKAPPPTPPKQSLPSRPSSSGHSQPRASQPQASSTSNQTSNATSKSSSSTAEVASKAIALEKFCGESETELSFMAGELITIINQGHHDWWYGTDTRGISGYFPRPFVQVLTAEEAARLETDDN